MISVRYLRIRYFSLVMVGIILLSVLLLAPPRIAENASPGTDVLQTEPPATAVLFLLDESGTVNGECRATCAVDKEAKRYEITRFFMTLMGAYHRQESEKNNLQIGVAQFATGYKLIFPFTPSSELFDEPDWGSFYERLSSTVPGAKEPEACNTNFEIALDEASKGLLDQEASEHILVLITDGRFEQEQQREAERSEVEDMLKSLESQVQVYVTLLGQSYVKQNPCGLSKDKLELWRGDIRAWKAWERDGLISLPDDDADLTRSLVDQPRFQEFLPKYGQWLEKEATFNFLSQTKVLKVMIVTSHPVDKDEVRLIDTYSAVRTEGQRRPAHPVQEWLQWDFTAPGSGGVLCRQEQWRLEIPVGVGTYFWYRTDTPTPRFQKLSVEPEELVLNDRKDTRDIAVTATLDKESLEGVKRFSPCYWLVFKLLGQKDQVLQESEAYPLDVEASHTFPLGNDIEPGQVTVLAQIESVTEPGVPSFLIDEKPKIVRINCDLELLYEEIREQPSKDGDINTVTIPVRCAPYVQGFAPEFQLELQPTYSTPESCQTLAQQTFSLSPITERHGHVTHYIVTVLYDEQWRDCVLLPCIKIKWDGFEDSWPLKPPPAPTPTPTPTPTPSVLSRIIQTITKTVNLALGVLLVIGIVVLLVFVLRARGRGSQSGRRPG